MSLTTAEKVKAVRMLLDQQQQPYGQRRRLLVDIIGEAGLPVPVEITSGTCAKYGSLRADAWKFLLSLDLGDAQREYLRMVKLGDVPERIRILHDIKNAKERDDQLARITSWSAVRRVLSATMWYLGQLLKEKGPAIQMARKKSTKEEVFVYTPGLASVCALLLTTVPEEEAFAALVVLCTTWFPAYFTPTVDGLRRGCALVAKVLELYDSELHGRLARENPMYCNQVVAPLLRTFLASRSPVKTSLRLFDAILAQGPSMLILLVAADIHCRRKKLLGAPRNGALLDILDISNGAESHNKLSQAPSSRSVIQAALHMAQTLPAAIIDALETHSHLVPPPTPTEELLALETNGSRSQPTPTTSPVKAQGPSTALRGRPRPGALNVQSPAGGSSGSPKPSGSNREGAVTPPTPKPCISLEDKDMKSPGSNIGWWNRDSPQPEGEEGAEGELMEHSPLRRSLLPSFGTSELRQQTQHDQRQEEDPQQERGQQQGVAGAEEVEYSPFQVDGKRFEFVVTDPGESQAGDTQPTKPMVQLPAPTQVAPPPVPASYSSSEMQPALSFSSLASSTYADPSARFAGPTLAWLQRLIDNAASFKARGFKKLESFSKEKKEKKEKKTRKARSCEKQQPYTPRLKGYLWTDDCASPPRTTHSPTAIRVDSEPGEGGIFALEPLYPRSMSPGPRIPKSRFLKTKKRPSAGRRRRSSSAHGNATRSTSVSSSVAGRPLPWESGWQQSAWESNVWVKRSPTAKPRSSGAGPRSATRLRSASVQEAQRGSGRGRKATASKRPRPASAKPLRSTQFRAVPRQVVAPPSPVPTEVANGASPAAERKTAHERVEEEGGHDLTRNRQAAAWVDDIVSNSARSSHVSPSSSWAQRLVTALTQEESSQSPSSLELLYRPRSARSTPRSAGEQDATRVAEDVPLVLVEDSPHLPVWPTTTVPRMSVREALQAHSKKKSKKPARRSKKGTRGPAKKTQKASKTTSMLGSKSGPSGKASKTGPAIARKSSTTRRRKKPTSVPKPSVNSKQAFNLSPTGKPMELEWGMRTSLMSARLFKKESEELELLLRDGVIDAPAATASSAEEATLAAEAAAKSFAPDFPPSPVPDFSKSWKDVYSQTFTSESPNRTPRYFERLMSSLSTDSGGNNKEGRGLVRTMSQRANDLIVEDYSDEKALLERFLTASGKVEGGNGNLHSRSSFRVPLSNGTMSPAVDECGKNPSDGFLSRLQRASHGITEEEQQYIF